MNMMLSLNNRLATGRNTKWTSEDPQENTFFYNYGTMLDFFDYSGARVQYARRYSDLINPVSWGFKFKPENERKDDYESLLKNILNPTLALKD